MTPLPGCVDQSRHRVAGRHFQRHHWLLFDLLLRNLGKPVTRERIEGVLWGDDPDGGPLNAEGQVRVYVHFIRRKLAGTGLRVATMHGEGYRMDRE